MVIPTTVPRAEKMVFLTPRDEYELYDDSDKGDEDDNEIYDDSV